MKITVLIVLYCCSCAAFAETYKCVQSGKTTYSSFPCGDNAQAVENHLTRMDGMPDAIIQQTNAVQAASPPTTAKPVQAVAPAVNCDNEEAEFEYVKKAMRAGYPASESNYWHDRFVNARDTYDNCEERRQKSLRKSY